MRTTTVRVVLAALVLAAAAAAPSLLAGDGTAPAPPAPLPEWKKGVQTGIVKFDGFDEPFTALVPDGYSPKKPCPAVLLMHGNGDMAANFLASVKMLAGKSPPLLISLERCDFSQKAIGYAPKYLAELRKQFALQDGKLFILGYGGGGFRLWDDVVCKAEESTKFRGIVIVAAARDTLDPPEKPATAPTVILVGDPKDADFKEQAPAAFRGLVSKDYEVIVLEHMAGRAMPPAEMKDVFAWIDAAIAGKKSTLSTRRVDESKRKDK